MESGAAVETPAKSGRWIGVRMPGERFGGAENDELKGYLPRKMASRGSDERVLRDC